MYHSRWQEKVSARMKKPLLPPLVESMECALVLGTRITHDVLYHNFESVFCCSCSFVLFAAAAAATAGG